MTYGKPHFSTFVSFLSLSIFTNVDHSNKSLTTRRATLLAMWRTRTRKRVVGARPQGGCIPSATAAPQSTRGSIQSSDVACEQQEAGMEALISHPGFEQELLPQSRPKTRSTNSMSCLCICSTTTCGWLVLPSTGVRRPISPPSPLSLLPLSNPPCSYPIHCLMARWKKRRQMNNS